MRETRRRARIEDFGRIESNFLAGKLEEKSLWCNSRAVGIGPLLFVTNDSKREVDDA